MNLKNLVIAFLTLAVLVGTSAGCAKYATKGTMMERVEGKAPVGMSEEAFTKSVTTAKLVEEEGNRKVYVVVVGEPCFICGSGKTFLRSYEIYATKFVFENGSLVSKDRIVSGK